jgi:chemotaxis protein histidine kinase CheA
MQSTSQPATSPHVDPHADPHDAIVELLHNHAQRVASDPSKLNVRPDGGKATPSADPSIVDDVHAALNDNAIRPSEFRTPATPARRGGIVSRTLFTLCAGVAVTIAWHTYADEAKEKLAQFVPQLFASTPAIAQGASPAEPQSQDAAAQAAAASQPAAAEAAPAQAAATPPAQPAQPATAAAPASAPAAQAPTQAALPPEVTQTIEAMSREIASLKQTVEQLKANQQQLSRDAAKAGEHESRRKPAKQTSQTSSASPQSQRAPAATSSSSSTPPYAAAVQRAQASAPYVPPPPAYRPSPAASGTVQRDAYIPPPPPAPAPVPRRLPPEPGYENAPRPPMPLQY